MIGIDLTTHVVANVKLNLRKFISSAMHKHINSTGHLGVAFVRRDAIVKLGSMRRHTCLCVRCHHMVGHFHNQTKIDEIVFPIKMDRINIDRTVSVYMPKKISQHYCKIAQTIETVLVPNPELLFYSIRNEWMILLIWKWQWRHQHRTRVLDSWHHIARVHRRIMVLV